MKKKYLLQTPIKVAFLARALAKLIDVFIAVLLSFVLYPFGVLLGVTYLSIADSLQNGESIGKKLIGFSVISLEDGQPCSLRQSIIRNIPLSVPLFFSVIPLWGWIITLFLGVPILVLEFYFLYRLDSGHRLGDVVADTTVMGHDGQNIGNISVKPKASSWFEEGSQASP